ncbi:MAG: hypothetical protein MZU79_05240 [Anaerotruncus sp.]|nr:hypothetical protein [Anaerotruncus sp.]
MSTTDRPIRCSTGRAAMSRPGSSGTCRPRGREDRYEATHRLRRPAGGTHRASGGGDRLRRISTMWIKKSASKGRSVRSSSSPATRARPRSSSCGSRRPDRPGVVRRRDQPVLVLPARTSTAARR